LELLYLVARHRSAWSETRESAGTLRSWLEARLPVSTCSRVRTRAGVLTLESLIEDAKSAIVTILDPATEHSADL
jgi:hypothetical protein